MDSKDSQIIYVRCKRCNRPLNSNIAKQRGYGNHCWNIHNIEVKRKDNYLFDLPKGIK